MTYSNCKKLILIAAMLVTLQQNAQAQRPSYAGIRPANGLNQKDKYNAPQNGNPDVANRFGGVETTPIVQLPYGAEQRPPMGVPVVMPHSNYIPLGVEQQQVLVNNRIGGTDDVTNTNALTGSTTVLGATATPTTTTTQRLPMPLDAQGDFDLVNQLQSLPEDKRPFWFLNYQAIEAHRNGSNPPNIAAASAQRPSFLG